MLPHPQPHCCPHLGKLKQVANSIQLQRAQRLVSTSFTPCYARPTALLAAAPATDASTAASATSPAAQNQLTNVHARDAHAAAAPAASQAKYLSYQEYVAMQEQFRKQQQEQQQASGDVPGQRADETAHASTSAPSQESSGKRVPWNKGRKHSAMTIARISEATARALARPEVKAKLDAWNQSRIGSHHSESEKKRIGDRSRAALAARRENMSPEELEADSAHRSALAKQLWQDPEYAAKTLSAVREAGKRRAAANREKKAAAGQGVDGEGSSSDSSSSRSESSSSRSSSSGSSKKRSSGSQASRAAGEGSSSERQQPDKHEKKRQPTQKELAAMAKLQQEHQREQLQKHLDHMLQTQRLIATTEQTLLQLRSNMAAFENNPQAKATAAAALQQAQAYLDPARQRVSKLQESLDQYGVHWDPVTGQMTHINHEPLDKKASKARSSKSAGASSSSSSSSSSRSGSSRRAAGAAAAAAEVGPDVVRSSRRQQVQDSSMAEADSGMLVSTRRRGVAAEAAASGGSRLSSSTGDGDQWTPLRTGAASSGAATPVNGHSSNGKNGHSSSSSSSIGSSSGYVPLHVHRTLSSVDDEDVVL